MILLNFRSALELFLNVPITHFTSLFTRFVSAYSLTSSEGVATFGKVNLPFFTKQTSIIGYSPSTEPQPNIASKTCLGHLGGGKNSFKTAPSREVGDGKNSFEIVPCREVGDGENSFEGRLFR